MKFKSVIKILGVNPYILVSHSQASIIKPGWKKPIPVLVKINDQPKEPWHINMMPVGNGDFYLYLHGDVRKASDTKVGNHVNVELSFDDDYRDGPLHPTPLWFSEALEKNSTAKKNWEALIPSRKKEILRYFFWLKTEEAKMRNMEKVVHVLSGKKGRFMARSWDIRMHSKAG